MVKLSQATLVYSIYTQADAVGFVASKRKLAKKTAQPAEDITTMNQCFLCLERAECTEKYHGHYFMITCKRQIEAKHRSLRQVSPSAVKQNVRLMHEDAERWRQGFVAFKPGQDRLAAAEAARK